jgi:ubiquinone/menaquinone biosynthesis C-methylase UbiE
MTAVKMGDRFLQIGCTDAALLAAIAAKVGLSGRACVAVESEAEALRSRAGAARSGMLLDVEVTPFGQLPYEDNSFDVVVIDSLDGLIAHASPEGRAARLREAPRLLVPRGRLVVIERLTQSGLAGLFSRQPVDPDYRASGGAASALQAAEFRAVRVLAERDGLAFVEGVR